MMRTKAWRRPRLFEAYSRGEATACLPLAPLVSRGPPLQDDVLAGQDTPWEEAREDEMTSHIEYFLSKGEITSDQWASLIGRLVFNHEGINDEARSAVPKIREAQALWVHGPSGQRSLQIFSQREDPLTDWITSQGAAELRSIFGKHLCVWLSIQCTLLKDVPQDVGRKIGDTLSSALSLENTIRNKIVHAQLSPTNLEGIIYHTLINNSSGRKRGKSEVRKMDKEQVSKFLEMQTVLKEVLFNINEVLWSNYFLCEESEVQRHPDRYDPDTVEFLNEDSDWFSLSDNPMLIAERLGEGSPEEYFEMLIRSPTDVLREYLKNLQVFSDEVFSK